ncbi:uncharacterized protein [Trachinotus anak]|uniref:uncharacterized protein n=1 Tax=Trachinotus anak TaxID=443729 RepID=UPI0039F17EF0
MKVLVVFLLGCSLAQGWLVSKCELRDQLMRAIGDLTEKEKQRGLSGENLVAKIVCHVELSSGFNTSAVNELLSGMEDDHHRGRRHASFGGMFSLAELEGLGSTVRPHTRERRHAREPSSHGHPTPPIQSPQREEELWTLYGLFQLSNHLVCSDGMTPSPNICGTSCSNLVDEDIRDDISCVLKILTNLVENGFGSPHWEQLKRMIRLIFQEVCRDVQASEYFAECS